ncbi:MAG: hypothetical protein FJ245_01425 [Nitrospira sp.]|nr:hypothetical protein [Nitrospira sp.]
MLNLLSLLIGGSGIFVVLTKFNVPELNMSFFDENPFAIKRDVIENVMTWIFTSLALVGLFLQVGGEIWSDRLPSRQHASSFYAYFSVASFLAVVATVYVLTSIGNQIAKRTWLPVVVAKQAELYSQTRFVVDHDGWREDQLSVRNTLPNPEIYRQKNIEAAVRSIAQIEKPLDIPPDGAELKLRVERIKPFFNNL